MTKEIKPTASKEETFDRLEIRVGRVIDVEIYPSKLKIWNFDDEIFSTGEAWRF